MLKILKEYSYLFCLGSSILLFSFLYFAGWLPEDVLKNLGEKGRAAEHMTFVEKAEDFTIAEELEILSEHFIPGKAEGKERRTIKQIIWEVFLMKNYSENEENQEETQMIENVDKTESEIKKDLVEVVEAENSNEQTKRDEISEKESMIQIQGQLNPGKKQELETGKPGDNDKKEWIFQTKDNTYFDDALFIGDSRTEGLREYGNLGKAEVIADSGMSIYRLWKESYTIKGKKQTLEEVLTNYRFNKIYLMLGVNELGYDFEQTKKRYEEGLEKIREKQPEAIIYLQANLHVTDEKSKDSEIYNNENINRMNQMIRELAEKNHLIFLDVNPLFDDENGNLSKEFTVDQAHILGIYYIDWANWILEHCAVLKEKA